MVDQDTLNVELLEALGCSTSDRIRRAMARAGRPPTLATSIDSSSPTMAESAHPHLRFSFSASGMGIRSPTAMSLVK